MRIPHEEVTMETRLALNSTCYIVFGEHLGEIKSVKKKLHCIKIL